MKTATFIPSVSGEASAELARIVEQLTAQALAEPDADFQALLADHPQYAAQLEYLLPAMQVMADVGRSGDSSITQVADNGHAEDHTSSALGDFHLIREIGRGGMGIVYEAEQISLRRRVAVKVLPLAGVLDKRALARFQNEARAAATLFHPHIVPVFFVGVERGVHFYAMQLIEGQSLAEVIATLRQAPVAEAASFQKTGDRGQETEARSQKSEIRSQRSDAATSSGQQPTAKSQQPSQSEIRNLKSEIETQPIAAISTEFSDDPKRYFHRVAEIGIQAAQALHHAHEHGILHRDVKPGNILLDEDGKAWITDFGLARLEADASMTATGDLVGTLRYMSPEQIGGSRAAIDQRTDIYSLGVTLYELTTGVPAFAGQDRHDLLRRIAESEPRPPRQVRSEIPNDLETIILKATEKTPADRYRSATELADDLRRYMSNEPVQARRPSMAARASKWARRHGGLVASAAIAMILVSVLLVAGVTLLGLAYQRESRLRADAETHKRAADANAQKAERILARAEASFAIATDSVDSMVHTLASERLASIPELQSTRQELFEEARKLFSRLIEVDPNNSQAYVRRGQICEALLQADEALADYDQAIALDPANHDAYFRLFEFRQYNQDSRHNDEERALEHLNRAIELAPDVQSYQAARAPLPLTDYQEALRFYERAIAADPSNGRLYNGRAWKELQQSNLERALEDSDMAVELDPQWDIGHKTRGMILQELGRYDAALESLDAAVRINPYGGDHYYERGNAYRALGRIEDALADFSAGIALKPGFSFFYKRRAEAYFALENYKAALDDIRRGMELNPDDLGTLTWFPFASCPDKRIAAEFLEIVNEAVERHGNSAGALLMRAVVRADFGKLDLAAADLDAVIATDDAPVYTYYVAALLALSAGDEHRFEEMSAAVVREFAETDNPHVATFAAWTPALAPGALDDYETAIALAQRALANRLDDRHAKQTLGAILLRSDQFADAREHLAAAAETAPSANTSAAYSLYLLAMAEYHLGRQQEARAWLERANQQTESELDKTTTPTAWNRRATLKLLQAEAESLIDNATVSKQFSGREKRRRGPVRRSP